MHHKMHLDHPQSLEKSKPAHPDSQVFRLKFFRFILESGLESLTLVDLSPVAFLLFKGGGILPGSAPVEPLGAAPAAKQVSPQHC